MAKPRVDAGGGMAALRYTLRKGREAGGAFRLYRRLRSRNACKTCAFGMGGQRGGMVNEVGSFPEVCKKSIQAVVGDLQAPIPEETFRTRSIEDLARLTPREMEHLGRLAFPVIAEPGASHFRRLGWDEALDRIAAALRATPPERAFVYGSGRSSNEAAFLMQTFARAYGTPHIHNCSSYCHQASGVALSRMVGSGTATVVLEDLDLADCAVVAGANPASNHPRLIVKLVELRKRGGRVVVINPVRELGLTRFRVPSKAGSMLFGDDVSDLYLQPHVGGDIAVFKGILKALLASGGVDREFVGTHVEDWDAVERDAAELDWNVIEARGGVPRAQLERAAEIVGDARHGILMWAMGLTHHEHGVDNIGALGNLALARGWLGRPGAGLMPIRGHSNVQGVGSVGFSPAVKTAFAEAMERHYGVRAAAEPGLDTFGSMVAAHEGRIDTAILLGGNLWGSNPDLAWAGEALRRIGTTASITTKLNPGHVHGRGETAFVLPVLARDEEHQSTTQESMFNFVRLSDGGQSAPEGELKSEVEVVCALAARVLPDGPFPFERMTDHRAVREAIARVVPGWDALREIDRGGGEFQVTGRTFHRPTFATASGKARAALVALPEHDAVPGTFRLMTFRSEGQFNTVVYEEEDLYRGIDRRDVVLMAAADLERLGLSEGDPVEVSTETGSLDVVAMAIDIPPGNAAMYYPEANALVPRRIDAASGTPAFKSVAARIRARS
jgi:molybdopterin-dependent oxidoreductase alpha subunit